MKGKIYFLLTLLFLPMSILAQGYDGIIFVHPGETEAEIKSRQEELKKEQEKAFMKAWLNQADLHRKNLTLDECHRAYKDLLRVRKKKIYRKDNVSLAAMDDLLEKHNVLREKLVSRLSAQDFRQMIEPYLMDLYVAWKKLYEVNAPLAEEVFRPLDHYYWVEHMEGKILYRDGRPLSALAFYVENEELRIWLKGLNGEY